MIIEARADNNSNDGNPLFRIYSIVPTETQRTDTAIDDNNISTHLYTESKAAYKIGAAFAGDFANSALNAACG
jgi:hypothetical protein